MSRARSSAPRGSFVVYGMSFVLMLAAGLALVSSAKGLLESTRLLWASSGLSAAAIVVAVVALISPRRR